LLEVFTRLINKSSIKFDSSGLGQYADNHFMHIIT
jgi:hypothetical protein